MKKLFYKNRIKRLHLKPGNLNFCTPLRCRCWHFCAFLIFCQSNQITDFGKTTVWHALKLVLSDYLFFPLKGITCMGYFMTYKKTSFIFMMHMAPPWLWYSCLQDYNLLIKINQMFLQSHVMLLPSTYPLYLMRHVTGSEYNQDVYFLLANKEK